MSAIGFVVPELNAEGIPIPFALDNWIDAFQAANPDIVSISDYPWTGKKVHEMAIGGITVSVTTLSAHKVPVMEFNDLMDREYVDHERDVQTETVRTITGTERGRLVTFFESSVSRVLLPRMTAPEIRYSASMWLQSYGFTKALISDRRYDQVTRNSKILSSAQAIVGRVKHAAGA